MLDEETVASEECPYLISAMTEMLSTALLMFLGCGGCFDVFGIGPLLPALSFGLAVLIATQTVGAISPCHMNPAISVGLLVMGEMNWKRCLVYLISQYIGALLGFGVLYVSVPKHEGLCLLTVKLGTPLQAFLLEMVGTFSLMMVVCGAAVEKKFSGLEDSKYLRFGFGIAGIVIAIETFTGCGINSARSLPPAVFYNNWKNHWLYEVAPIMGGTIAGLMYRFIFHAEEPYSLYRFAAKHKS